MKPLVLLLLLLAGPATAGPLSDLIMAPGVLADALEGEVLRYSHTRRVPLVEEGKEMPGAASGITAPEAVVAGEIILTAKADALILSLAEAGESQQVATFPLVGSNPILLFFLENMVRSATVQTGGSPYYIRNRIKDALVGSDLGTAGAGLSSVVLHPFRDDSHRDKLGAFADLTITIRFDPAAPGRLVELLADTGTGANGYSESLTLMQEK